MVFNDSVKACSFIFEKNWKVTGLSQLKIIDNYWAFTIILKNTEKSHFLARHEDQNGKQIDRIFECESNSVLKRTETTLEFDNNKCKLIPN